MKIAIVHDWLVEDAGAEKVLKALLDIYPDAELFSLVNFLNEEATKNILGSKRVNTSFLQKLPFAKKHFRNYLPLFPLAIESFNLQEYALIISSSWAVAKGVRTTKKQTHVCYCHTPIRYAWDFYEEYTSSLDFFKKILVKASLFYIRRWDIATLSRVDYFIANSQFVQKRIKRIYNQESQLIYPPIDLENFSCCVQKEDYYITASRLVPYKKTQLIVQAFNAMPEKKLIVIGDGVEYNKIAAIAKSNITLLGYQNKKNMIGFLQKAKAFVYGAIEDFGIVPIEALACGTPVIALNDGGTAETVVHKKNGLHFQKQTTDEIIKAIQTFETMKFVAKEITNSASLYSTPRFKQEISDFIKTIKL